MTSDHANVTAAANPSTERGSNVQDPRAAVGGNGWLDRSRWLVEYRDRTARVGTRADLRDDGQYARVIAQLFERRTIYCADAGGVRTLSSVPLTNSATRHQVGLETIQLR